jgi:hypothetical protein
MPRSNQVQYSWRELNRLLPEMTELQVKELLDEEMSSLRRVAILERLHQRYNALRIARERIELIPSVLKESESLESAEDQLKASHETSGDKVIQGSDTNRKIQDDGGGHGRGNVDAVVRVDVVKAQAAVGREILRGGVGSLCEGVSDGRGDGGRVVGAGEGDVHRVVGGVVVGQRDGLAGLEELQVGVVHRAGPVDRAGGGDVRAGDGQAGFEGGLQAGVDRAAAPEVGATAGESRLVTLAIPDLEKRNEEAVFDALNKFEKKCPYCGKEQYRVGIRDKIEIDHFVPISKGGQNVPWNIIPVCKECNRKKRDHLPQDFLPTEVFVFVSGYLASVKARLQQEGYDDYVASGKIVSLIKQHESFIRDNSRSEFIRQLIHLVCAEEAPILLGPPGSFENLDDSFSSIAKDDDEAKLEQLSRMSIIEYNRVRLLYSKKMSIGVRLLDNLVGERRNKYNQFKQYENIIRMVNDKSGIFVSGVIGSPFNKVCEHLSSGQDSILSVRALFAILSECGWKDMGRIQSREHQGKKHVFCSPELAFLSKSDIRRRLENGERGIAG